MFQGDVKSKFFEDTNATSNTYVAAAARPTTTFTLANSSFGTNTGRKITATTLGNESTITVTIVGTDVNGDSVTEVITLPGSASTTSGTTAFFQTITSATVSAQPAANVSLGMTDDVAGGIFAGRTRVRQMQVSSGGSAGNV